VNVPLAYPDGEGIEELFDFDDLDPFRSSMRSRSCDFDS